ncbi:GAF domain-containing protein [Naasia lichenicola]|uniref:GAF domain-containing protein n=1 Tax=Naasia lichenicola TaxID=2565933 RepID=A0A4S4FIA5_9MICO|nr:GAF domain-containing protein [Naasia lichenicola]THG30073.1 GAF domain-containing protein [Naasia lichenicola]
MPLYEHLRAPLRMWYANMLQAAPSTPHPRGDATVRVGPEGDTDRVLLIGNGPLHGWGVSLHDLAVPGQLARALNERSSRSASVEYVGDERMNAASTLAWLGNRAAAGHDLIVIALGMNDALRLTRLDDWKRDYAAVLDRVLSDIHPAAQVILVGLPNIRAYAMANSSAGSVAQLHADRMTEFTVELAQNHPRVTAVHAPAEKFEAARPLGSPKMYQAWAEALSIHLSPVLETIRAAKPFADETERRWEWAGTERAVRAASTTDGRSPLDEIVREAQEMFGVSLAAVNVLDGDRNWFVANSGGAPSSMPRELAYCNETVAQDRPVVVPDSAADDRFKNNPFLDVVQLPFYAGIPLHSEDGRAVGTLCILDGTPRKASAVDLQRLQVLADRAERELALLAAGTRAASEEQLAPA